MRSKACHRLSVLFEENPRPMKSGDVSYVL